MQLKKLLIIILGLVFLSGFGYGYIWLQIQQKAENERLSRMNNSCLKLAVVWQGALLNEEKERIYLSLSQSPHLKPLDEAFTLANQEIGLLFSTTDSQMVMVSSKPILKISESDQQVNSEIVASFVGSAMGDRPEIGQQVAAKLALAQNLNLADGSKTLDLQFAC